MTPVSVRITEPNTTRLGETGIAFDYAPFSNRFKVRFADGGTDWFDAMGLDSAMETKPSVLPTGSRVRFYGHDLGLYYEIGKVINFHRTYGYLVEFENKPIQLWVNPELILLAPEHSKIKVGDKVTSTNPDYFHGITGIVKEIHPGGPTGYSHEVRLPANKSYPNGASFRFNASELRKVEDAKPAPIDVGSYPLELGDTVAPIVGTRREKGTIAGYKTGAALPYVVYFDNGNVYGMYSREDLRLVKKVDQTFEELKASIVGAISNLQKALETMKMKYAEVE